MCSKCFKDVAGKTPVAMDEVPAPAVVAPAPAPVAAPDVVASVSPASAAMLPPYFSHGQRARPTCARRVTTRNRLSSGALAVPSQGFAWF